MGFALIFVLMAMASEDLFDIMCEPGDDQPENFDEGNSQGRGLESSEPCADLYLLMRSIDEASPGYLIVDAREESQERPSAKKPRPSQNISESESSNDHEEYGEDGSESSGGGGGDMDRSKGHDAGGVESEDDGAGCWGEGGGSDQEDYGGDESGSKGESEDGGSDSECAVPSATTCRGALFRTLAPSVAEVERIEVLGYGSIAQALSSKCGCRVPCPIRASLTFDQCYRLRETALQFSLSKGCRLQYLAGLVQTNNSDSGLERRISAHVKEGGPPRAKKSRFFLVGTEVCATAFATIMGVSKTMVRKACEFDIEKHRAAEVIKRECSESHDLKKALALNCTIERMDVVTWLIEHADEFAAEQLPMGENLESAAAFQEMFGDADELCTKRVHASGITMLYGVYREGSMGGRLYTAVGKKIFADVFYNDPRVAHIALARKRDNFGICATCSDCKGRLQNQHLTPMDRCAVLTEFSQHITYIAREREVYSQDAKKTRFDLVTIPGTILIRGILTLHIDKMTGNTTALPALFPFPKCLNSADRLPVVIVGVVVHGIGYFTFKSYASSSGGCNLTIEVLYRLFVHLQGLGYRFTDAARIHADNHTDNKTPAVLLFLGWLIAQNVLTSAVLSFFMPGHGHGPSDQKNSCNSRAIHKAGALVISENRLDLTLKGAFKKECNKPTIVSVTHVRDWSRYFSAAMSNVGLERLACSQGSSDAQMQYMFDKGPGGSVRMTYKASLHGPEVYPRVLNVGSSFTSDAHGIGSVTASAFDSNQGLWRSTVVYHHGFSEVVVHPPGEINLFPSAELIPAGAPPIEPMQAAYPAVFGRAKRMIVKARQSLRFFNDEGVAPGVAQEWDDFLVREAALVARCTATPDAPLYDGPSDFVALHPCIPPEHPFDMAARRPRPPPVFNLDPVVHSGFTASERAALEAAARLPPRLIAGKCVLLRLPFAAQMPSTHILPVCVGMLPGNFHADSVPEDGFIDFRLMSTSARDIAGAWKEVKGDGAAALVAKWPLRCILMSGIELTQANKLSAASMKKITSCIAPFELTPSAPLHLGGLGTPAAVADSAGGEAPVPL